MSKRKQSRRGKRRTAVYATLALGLLALLVLAYLYTQSPQEKRIILYVDQGNGAVNCSNFEQMLAFASSHGFNTIFFQVYREGVLLFTSSQLGYFVNETHAHGQKIFFALYLTNSTQTIPNTILNLGQDGVNLDMSALDISTQKSLLGSLESSCHCETAVTTTDMASTLKPDLLVLETYGPTLQEYIRQGVIAGVGVFATSSQADYQSQF